MKYPGRLFLVFMGLVLIIWAGLKCNPEIVPDGPTVIYKEGRPVQVKYVVYDTVVIVKPILKKVYVKINGESLHDTIRTYYGYYKDSLTDVEVTDSVKGEVLGQVISVRSRSPVYLQRDSVFTWYNVSEPARRKVYAGISFYASPVYSYIAPVVTFIDKKGNSLTGGYDIVNRGVQVSFQKQLSLRKRKWYDP